MNFKLNIKDSQRGFSIIEMVVSLAIFLLIIGLVVDIFISMIQHQNRMLGEEQLLNQVSFAEEYMSRSLRMAVAAEDTGCLSVVGRLYELTHCTGDTTVPCSGVKFINQSEDNTCQEFYLDATDPANPILKSRKWPSAGQDMLSTRFHINRGSFIINGDKAVRSITVDDYSQPRITMLLDVTAPDNQRKIIQTTVSQRNLNNNH